MKIKLIINKESSIDYLLIVCLKNRKQINEINRLADVSGKAAFDYAFSTADVEQHFKPDYPYYIQTDLTFTGKEN